MMEEEQIEFEPNEEESVMKLEKAPVELNRTLPLVSFKREKMLGAVRRAHFSSTEVMVMPFSVTVFHDMVIFELYDNTLEINFNGSIAFNEVSLKIMPAFLNSVFLAEYSIQGAWPRGLIPYLVGITHRLTQSTHFKVPGRASSEF
ncbi:uncharacterized protein LOC131326535 isoform X2 [Rhododendron vialii]|nr:uncharacterized protein LOC131326535 isoform X2 [Rhododendron vialii]